MTTRTPEEIQAADLVAAFRDAAECATFVTTTVWEHGTASPALVEFERRTNMAAIQAGRELLEALEAAVPALREGDAAATGDTGTAAG